MLNAPVASRYGLNLQQLACYRNFASRSPVQASIEPHPEVQGLYTLTLNRPEAKNSLGHQLMKQLRNSLQTFKHQQARCLLINSAVQGTFCAGADLKERAAMSPEEGGDFVKSLRATFSAIAGLPVPTIAIVDGYAIGGGTELALTADLRVAGPSAKFSLPETRLGIIPGAGGTQRLPRLIGRSKSKEMIFTGRFVDAEEALDIGSASTPEQKSIQASLMCSQPMHLCQCYTSLVQAQNNAVLCMCIRSITCCVMFFNMCSRKKGMNEE
ncbi:TPA: hypothetical protein ACH3X1_011477 [Trebouxia sp. C0004]